MNAITREGTTFFTHLKEIAAKATQALIDINLYDPAREGPHVEKIEAAIRPFLETGKHTTIPDTKLEWLIDHQAFQAGIAFQALGSLDIASLWYQIGQYGWRGNAHWFAGNILDLDESEREGPAVFQENPAICAALANNSLRAEQLFGWISHNRVKTDLEIQFYEEARSYNAVWENLGFQIFALMWLGDRWREVNRLAEIGRRVIEKTRKAGYPRDFREPQLLIEIGWALSSYFLDPNEKNREMALNLLRLDRMHDRENNTCFNMLGYFFSLGQRYPEINPYPDAVFQARLWRPSACKRDTPPTRNEIRQGLEEIIRVARQKKKYYVRVSSVDLHLLVGGYPGPRHQLPLCCEVMREKLKAGGKITGQSPEEGWLEIYYDIPAAP